MKGPWTGGWHYLITRAESHTMTKALVLRASRGPMMDPASQAGRRRMRPDPRRRPRSSPAAAKKLARRPGSSAAASPEGLPPEGDFSCQLSGWCLVRFRMVNSSIALKAFLVITIDCCLKGFEFINFIKTNRPKTKRVLFKTGLNDTSQIGPPAARIGETVTLLPRQKKCLV